MFLLEFRQPSNPAPSNCQGHKPSRMARWLGNGYVPKAEIKVDESSPLPQDLALAGDCPRYANKTNKTHGNYM